MKQGTGTLLLLIALSPVVVLAGAFATLVAFDKVIGGLPGIALLYVSVGLLVFFPGLIYRAAKVPLGLALSTGLLASAGFVLILQPSGPAFVSSPAPVNITIQNDAQESAAVDISGLSFVYPVILSRAASGPRYPYQLDANVISYVDIEPPPAHFSDNNGDTLDFSVIDKDELHVRDGLGGYADLHWDGSKFVLDSTHSEGLSAAVAAARRGPRNNHYGEWGMILTIVALSLSWVLVGWFVIQWRVRMGRQIGQAVAAAVLIAVGSGFVVWLAHIAAMPTSGDIPVGLPIAFGALVFGGPGFGIWMWQLISIGSEINRAVVHQNLTDPGA
jgi:hypothetical protein